MATNYLNQSPYIVDAGPYPGVYNSRAGYFAHMLGESTKYYYGTNTQQVLHSSWVPGEKYILPGDAWGNTYEYNVPPVQPGLNEGGNESGVARISPSELDPEPGADLRWRV